MLYDYENTCDKGKIKKKSKGLLMKRLPRYPPQLQSLAAPQPYYQKLYPSIPILLQII